MFPSSSSRRVRALMLAFLVSLLALPTSAAQADEYAGGVAFDPEIAGRALGAGGDGVIFAQAFTAQRSGGVSAVRVPVHLRDVSGSGSLIVTVRHAQDGKPTTAFVNGSSIRSEALPRSAGVMAHVTFDRWGRIEEGQEYAVVVEGRSDSLVNQLKWNWGAGDSSQVAMLSTIGRPAWGPQQDSLAAEVRVDAAAPEITVTEAPSDPVALDAVKRLRYGCADDMDDLAADRSPCTAVAIQGARRITLNSGDAVPTDAPGAWSIEIRSSDRGGNGAVKTLAYRVDAQAPSVTIAAPVGGALVPHDARIAADFSCGDEGGSGLASCVGTVPDGQPLPGGLGSHSFTVTATDGAGNETVEKRSYTVVDRTAPTISVTSPARGGTYAGGSAPHADFACDDEPGGSGLATCVGTVADGEAVDTAGTGEKVFRVVATDEAGNRTVEELPYTVVDRTDPTIDIAAPVQGARFARDERVVADFACADAGGSGLRSCIGSTADDAVLDTSTLGEHELTVTATDAADNEVTRTVTYVVVDVTAPKITVTAPLRERTYDGGSTELAGFECADDDGGSGIATCTGTVEDGEPFETTQTGTHVFEVEAVDKAGNSTVEKIPYAVVDVTRPTVDIASPIDGAKIVQGTDVKADFACADERGGSGVASCVGSTGDDQPLDTRTLGEHKLTVTATDGADNAATETVTYEVVDVTAPTVEVAAPLRAGTYDGGAEQVARFSCKDDEAGSGIATCTGTVEDGEPFETTQTGEHVFTVEAVDRSGNRHTERVPYKVVDVTKPTIEITSPAAGAQLTRGERVDADFACADERGGSGPASCEGSIADGAPLETDTLGEKTLTVDAADRAGNTRTRTVTYTVVDRTAPTITAAAGQRFVIGEAGQLAFDCEDEAQGSGEKSCAVDGFSTDAVGFHVATVRAEDVAGSVTTKEVEYQVVWPWSGFAAPVDGSGVLNVVKAGSAVPVKFSLDGDRGLEILDGVPTSRVVACDTSAEVDALEETTKSPSGLTYDSHSGRYHYVWKTSPDWVGTCRKLAVRLADGTVHGAVFRLR